MELFIGCSGFHYKEWKGKFYPEGVPQRLWFDYYCQHFNTLELNVTFYRFPQVSFLQNWYNKSPDNFKFAVKVPRAITHFKKFNGCTELLTDFYQTIKQGLAHKLGPVLFQLPPSFSYSEENLDRVLCNINPDFLNVIEFRHQSWWNDMVYHTLAKHDITFCGVSFPTLPNDNAIINTNVAYYRFHGVPVLFSSSYSPEFIQHIAQQIKAASNLKQCWVYFNNTMHMSAIENATYMATLFEQNEIK